MDYHLIDYIIRKQNYSLWRSCKNKFVITKNEHGTYGEYYDFIIKTEVCDNNYIIKIDVIADDKEYETQITNMVNEVIVSGNTQLDKFCFAILDCNM